MIKFEVGDYVLVEVSCNYTDTILKGVIEAYHGFKYHEYPGMRMQYEETYSVRIGYKTSEYPISKLTLVGSEQETEETPSVEIKETPVVEHKIESDGGPSDYYDFPSSWGTFNDFIEYKSENQWKGFSFHLGNIGKAICRWGDKDGTTEEYDAKKIIYSACRVLKMLVGTEKTRQYLQSLLDDEQFKP